MSSEQRLVRPFIGLGGFAGVLAQAKVQIGGHTISHRDTLRIPSNSFTHDPPVLVFADDEGDELQVQLVSACEQAEISPSDAVLLVIVSNPYLRIADIAFRARLDVPGSIPRQLDLRSSEEPPRALQTSIGGCDIELVVCLGRELPAQPLHPSRKGTWLARSLYRIRTELGELGLLPMPLDDDKRAELGLGLRTSRFVQIEDVESLLGERLDEALSLYVDANVLRTVSANPASAAAQLLQRQLFVDVISAIVTAVSKWSELSSQTPADLKGTALGALSIAAVSGLYEGSEDDLMDEGLRLLLNEPAKFVAAFDNRADSTGALLQILEVGQA